MKGILDRIAQSHAEASSKQFRPASPQHFLALRLAGRLGDAPAVHHYIELCDRHSEDRLLSAYRIAMKGGSRALAERFHIVLERSGRLDRTRIERDLAAIRIERRAIAVAIFKGVQLQYPPIAHQLSSDPDKAIGSAAMFINRIRDKCAFNNAAIELLAADCELQRSRLAKVVTEVLMRRQVAVWQFPKAEVVAAFGHPPLRFRRDVRETMAAMWPEVEGGFGSPLIHDALALGLYCQIEQMLAPTA